MNFWIDGYHWIRCEVISQAFGTCTVRLYNEAGTRKGRARRGLYGWLVEAQTEK